jgi:hypothetical protein
VFSHNNLALLFRDNNDDGQLLPVQVQVEVQVAVAVAVIEID